MPPSMLMATIVAAACGMDEADRRHFSGSQQYDTNQACLPPTLTADAHQGRSPRLLLSLYTVVIHSCLSAIRIKFA